MVKSMAGYPLRPSTALHFLFFGGSVNNASRCAAARVSALAAMPLSACPPALAGGARAVRSVPKVPRVLHARAARARRRRHPALFEGSEAAIPAAASGVHDTPGPIGLGNARTGT